MAGPLGPAGAAPSPPLALVGQTPAPQQLRARVNQQLCGELAQAPPAGFPSTRFRCLAARAPGVGWALGMASSSIPD